MCARVTETSSPTGNGSYDDVTWFIFVLNHTPKYIKNVCMPTGSDVIHII